MIDKSRKAIIVNLFGGPGSGKSTGAAYIYSKLKMHGICAELVTEFAKDKFWEETVATFHNQLYIFAKQYFRITRCTEKVDVIITDSPILLSLIYKNENDMLSENFDKMALELFNSYDTYNVMLNRVTPYDPVGRFQTEKESDELSTKIRNMLNHNDISYDEYPGNEQGYDEIVEKIIKLVAERTIASATEGNSMV